MRVHIVCYEDFDQWILLKFARKLQEELRALGVEARLANAPDPVADVNHHIIYYPYDCSRNGVDTLMVTHIDSLAKTSRVKRQLETADLGICMSRQTVQQLLASGIARDKLCYVSPAHDSVMRPRKTVLGITTRLYADGRKNENYLVKVAERIDPDVFRFKIMGNGWQAIVDRLHAMGMEVDYFSEFDYGRYVELVPSLDYYLYLSSDEGSMGFVDALAAGVKTIVTPQGFHLDVPCGITYSVNSVEDTVAALNEVARQKLTLTAAVADWTWRDYALKHLRIWEYLLKDRSSEYFQAHRHHHADGLASLAPESEEVVSLGSRLRVAADMAARSIFYWSRERQRRYGAGLAGKVMGRLMKR